jgi:hypothetical protein
MKQNIIIRNINNATQIIAFGHKPIITLKKKIQVHIPYRFMRKFFEQIELITNLYQLRVKTFTKRYLKKS